MYGIEGDVIVEEERDGFTSTTLLSDKKERMVHMVRS